MKSGRNLVNSVETFRLNFDERLCPQSSALCDSSAVEHCVEPHSSAQSCREFV